MIIYNKNLSISFIQGIFDGEGSVILSKNKFHVKLEMKNKLVMDIVNLILKNLGINPIRGIKNPFVLSITSRYYFKLKEFNLFRFNKNQIDKFMSIEKEIKHIQTKRNGLFLDILFFFYDKSNNMFNFNEIKTSTCKKINNKNARLALNNAINKNYIVKFGKGNRGNPYKYKISIEGLNYIKEKLEEESNNLKFLEENLFNSIRQKWELN